MYVSGEERDVKPPTTSIHAGQEMISTNVPARTVAWLFASSAVLAAVASLIALCGADWVGLLRRSELKPIFVLVPVVVGYLLALGGMVALPVALAREVWKSNRSAVPMAYALAAVSVVAVLLAGWPAAPLSVANVVACGVVIWRLSPTLVTEEPSVRRYSLPLGYVLLVAGSLWGLHDYYLSRSWAGIVKLALLLLGTLAVGTFFTYVFFLVLAGLVAFDAAMLPARVRALRAEMPFVPQAQV